MTRIHYYLIVLVVLLSVSITHAQDAGNLMYNNDILHEIYFEFEEATYWDIMTSNYENTPEGGSVPYLMGRVTIDGTVVDSVGVRFKGYTSYVYGANKKPIKIDFNEFVSGKKYDGLKKMNLNNGTGDPSMQRDVICYDLLRSTGVKAPRTSYSKVYFNGEYWGVYQNIEQIDKTFLKRNFDNEKGNLFKNKGWSFFEWEGTNPYAYHPPFELKTNKEGNDWSGFVNLMDVLNNSSDADFPEAIEEVFNVDLFLKTLAVDVATENWDSYLEHGRNWYVYEDTTSGVFNWIPWDYNFTLVERSEECSVFPLFVSNTNGATGASFFSTSFYFGNPSFLWNFGDGMTSTLENPVHVYDVAGSYNVCLTVAVNSDCFEETCIEINTEVNQTCESLTNGSCPHPLNSTFLEVILSESSCCESWSEACEDIYIEIEMGFDGLGATYFKVDQQENNGVLIERLLNVPAFNNRYYTYFCDLLNYQMTEEHLFGLIDHNKTLISAAVESDPNFLFSYEEFITDISADDVNVGIKKILSRRIDEMNTELTTLISCPSITSTIPWNDVVVNEFVASTDSTYAIMDLTGEVEDWIEIFNNTTNEIDLTGVYFSDKINDLQKWQFPAGTIIPAEGYLIVWADKDEEQQGLHSNFKLNKDGEQLVLSNADGSIIDSLTFEAQSPNISSARRPNGTGDFVFQDATHGYNNGDTSSVLDVNGSLNVSVYPIPASDYLDINIQNDCSFNYTVRVYTVTGQLILKQKQNTFSFRLNVNSWNEGFYLLRIVDDNGNSKTQKIIINH